MNKIVFYYASRISKIKYLRPGDRISIFSHVPYYEELYIKKEDRRWDLSDLDEDYSRKPKIVFKDKCYPIESPYLYRGLVKENQIIKNWEYPYFFTFDNNNRHLIVEQLNNKETIDLIRNCEMIYDYFCEKKK